MCLVFRNFAIKYKPLVMSDRILLYLSLPPYLAQWYANECRMIELKDRDKVPHTVYKPFEPVFIPRNSQECRVLQCFLQKQPEIVAKEQEDANIAIVIPYFRDKNPMYYNYLGQRGRQQLADTIRNRFCLDLWEGLHTFRNALSRQDNAIYAYMESHGIECSETNWNALAKIYQRQRSVYYKEKSRKKHIDKTPRK